MAYLKVREIIEALRAYDPEVETNIKELSLQRAYGQNCVKEGYVMSGRTEKPYKHLPSGKLVAEAEAVEWIDFPETLWLE